MHDINHHTINVQRRSEKFVPDSTRVLIRPFIPLNSQRIVNIIGRAMTLTDAEVDTLLAEVLAEFSGRHFDIERVFERHFEKVRPQLFTDRELSRPRKLLIGSYFTSEYALESAALFNPSIVPHPDQSNLPKGALRFVMSLRATGEGHISSIEFRSGVIDGGSGIKMDAPSRHVTTPEMVPNPEYDKSTFLLKLQEMGFHNVLSKEMMAPLADTFSLSQLHRSIAASRRKVRIRSRDEQRTVECLTWLAESNYEITFRETKAMSERIIFPVSANESNGIEDARFVQFHDEDGSMTYFATYTAYNGRVILPQLIETKDFLKFKIVTLNGTAVQNKGMALFPRKIDGRYAMISRQDNENMFIMFSDNPHFWNDTAALLKPSYSWEFIQLGNCGSPIETEAGWLLLTHGVGPMRKYCIGAALLDLEDPSKVIGRLKEPLLKPNENEREGYVPNVVYTCGALVHGRELIIPYAMSDSASSIASVSLDEVLDALQRD
ncbi:MAG: glycoside hydrolase family 130 protein [Verrucomicrobiota bacterium]|nr:glycoside hydrolase family 130 protein [Verrucomicrobiota bacterium]